MTEQAINIHHPDEFEFSIHLWEAYRKSLRCDGAEVRFKNGAYNAPPYEAHTFQPSNEDWSQFWGAVDKLGVWNWHNRIKGPYTEFRNGQYHIPQLDGGGWSISLKKGEKEFKCSGNAYPDVKGTKYGKTFRRFMDAMNELVGEELFAEPLTLFPLNEGGRTLRGHESEEAHVAEENEYEVRTHKVFDKLGLNIVDSRRVDWRYTKGRELEDETGLRFWFGQLQHYDRFGLQALVNKADGGTLEYLTSALRPRGFTKKISGDNIEFYREIEFLTAESKTPDIAALIRCRDELLGILATPHEDRQSVIRREKACRVVFEEFTPAFQYTVCNGQPTDEKILDEELWRGSGVVYARTWEREVAYIGKSDHPLINRIGKHLNLISNPSTEGQKEYREWAENKTVTIYAHQPDNVEYLGLNIPIHVGLEHALISEINPPFVLRR